MEGEGGVTRSIIHELDSWLIEGVQIEGESMVLLEVFSMNVVLGIFKEIKRKVKVMLLEVSLMIFILGISNEIKWKVKVVFFEVSLMELIF